jgi:hypothetical protein
MSADRITSYWLPLLFGVAFLLLSFALSGLGVSLPKWTAPASAVAGVCLLAWAGALAYRKRSGQFDRSGGAGGDASVTGTGSSGFGGAGGSGRTGRGGKGGNATVKGQGSVARGGRGGAA